METLFNCPTCGYENVFNTDEDTKHINCEYCANGTMDRVGSCEELPFMIRMERD